MNAGGIDVIEKTTASGTVTAFPVYDGHGNMVATLSRSGTGFAVNDRRSFDAWGALRTGNATGDPKGRYVANLGHVQDDESGLVYMRARYYEASTGRFVSEDPSTDGINWFVYCGNDPVNFVDRSGTFKAGEWEFRIDFDKGLLSDLHVRLVGGGELFSIRIDGTRNPGHAAGEITRDMFRAILRKDGEGHSGAINLLKGLKDGLFGFDIENITKWAAKGKGFALMAYTSVDAYAQTNPLDFIDLMTTLFSYGKD